MELLRVGPGAPVPRECYIQYGSVTGLGFILLVPRWLFIPAPSAKNFSFFSIVLNIKDIISSVFKLCTFQGCYVLYGYSISSWQRN